MGYFDYIECNMELPIEGFNGRRFQTKDTPAQRCEFYQISDDGDLIFDSYKADPCKCTLTGAIVFYDFVNNGEGWVEFEANFKNGKIDKPIVKRQLIVP